jgi:hypothetical protein
MKIPDFYGSNHVSLSILKKIKKVQVLYIYKCCVFKIIKCAERFYQLSISCF